MLAHEINIGSRMSYAIDSDKRSHVMTYDVNSEDQQRPWRKIANNETTKTCKTLNVENLIVFSPEMKRGQTPTN